MTTVHRIWIIIIITIMVVIIIINMTIIIFLIMVMVITSAVLRLECSLVCISGSVGHKQNIFRSFSHCQRFF